jgi:Holliday junction resolvasome RuvABC endonuclease subunit
MTRGEMPTWGTLNLEIYPTRHERLGRFTIWLTTAYHTDSFEALAWERPLLMPHDKLEELLLLYGLAGIAQGFAYAHNLLWQEISPGDVKRALTGMAQAPKGQKIDKKMMVAAAYKLGWEVLDHHQADALGVGLCAYSAIWPKVAA